MKRPPTSLRRPPAPPPPEPPPALVESFVRSGDPQAPADAQGRPETPTGARGRLRGSKTVVTREGGRERRKVTVYLEPATAAALARYLDDEGGEASVFIDRAVVERLRGKGYLP